VTLVSRSLRLKISFGVCLALIVLLAPLNWVQYQLQRRAAMRELELLAVSTGTVAEHSLEQAMLTNNRSAIQAIVDSVSKGPGVRSVYLLTSEARVAASPGGLRNGEQLDRTSPTCQSCHRLPTATRPRGIVVRDTDGQPVFRTMVPVLNRPACHRCHSPDDHLNGVFYMDFSMAGFTSRVQRGLQTAFLGSVTIIALSAGVLYVLLSRLIITPMEQVAQGMRRFSQGERQVRAPVRSQDEVGLLAGVFNEMADTIQAQESAAEDLYSELESKDTIRRDLLARLITTREEERRHLSREIHDELGQLLTGLSLNLKLCQQALSGDLQKAQDHLATANGLVRQLLDQSHRLIINLRPTVLDDYGLIPALEEELNQRLTPVGIAARLHTQGQVEELPGEVATAAFRIAQEAITNVIRHAEACQVDVYVQRTAGGLSLTIEDDGVGLPDNNQSSSNGRQPLGILGMQERAEGLGGRLEVARCDPQGTRVTLWLPLNGEVP
jgi:signal transduction histidine kinase